MKLSSPLAKPIAAPTRPNLRSSYPSAGAHRLPQLHSWPDLRRSPAVLSMPVHAYASRTCPDQAYPQHSAGAYRLPQFSERHIP
jgi:hypothetical protein